MIPPGLGAGEIATPAGCAQFTATRDRNGIEIVFSDTGSNGIARLVTDASATGL
jgi:hypothetical protein